MVTSPSPGPKTSGDGALARAVRTVWAWFCVFLEVIGLKRTRSSGEKEQIDRLRVHHTAFRTLLSSNDRFLEIVAGLERAAHGEDFVDPDSVRSRAVRALTDIHRMVASLNEISSHRYAGLDSVVQRLAEQLSDAMRWDPVPLVVDVDAVSASDGDVAGGKMANLGEVRNVVGIPTPDGFVATTPAFHKVRRSVASLTGEVSERSADERLPEAAATATALANVPLPGEVVSAVTAGFARLSERLGHPPRVAVRSSAVGEDSSRSFAGQYLTLLNVPHDGILQAYQRVLASLYAPEAAHYRRLHLLEEDSASMAVGFLVMVNAVASGVAYSRDPAESASDVVLISAVHGLGARLVEGGSAAEEIRVFGDGESGVLTRSPGPQATALEFAVDEGLAAEEVDAAAPRLTLSDEEVRLLARWARLLESHFGAPQDIEWALDGERRLFVLQTRPLHLTAERATAPVLGDAASVILRGGMVACPGAGSGPAILMEGDDDLTRFPEGGVLVSRRPSPRFVRVLPRARAIVTDAGSVTGHMASLAREFGVPALLATGSATHLIAEGSHVTVDATNTVVYAGDLLHSPHPVGVAAPTTAQSTRFATRTSRLLADVRELIVPLNLTDTRSRSFAPSACRTLHDVARFVHEKSFEEMFRLGEQLGDVRSASFLLDVFLPMDLYVIDLGGGLNPPAHGTRIKPGHVTSPPLQALLRGLLDRRLQRWGPRPIDVGGLLGIMARHAFSSPEEERTFRDPCYALVSDQYLNYTARVGYHFGVVDTFCSPAQNRNYVSFRFRGGAADRSRRQRRAQAIGAVLREFGFTVESARDAVRARLSKATRDEILEQLENVGRLLQFFRQMDAAMNSDEAAEHLTQAFLDGKFDLT